MRQTRNDFCLKELGFQLHTHFLRNSSVSNKACQHLGHQASTWSTLFHTWCAKHPACYKTKARRVATKLLRCCSQHCSEKQYCRLSFVPDVKVVLNLRLQYCGIRTIWTLQTSPYLLLSLQNYITVADTEHAWCDRAFYSIGMKDLAKHTRYEAARDFILIVSHQNSLERGF